METPGPETTSTDVAASRRPRDRARLSAIAALSALVVVFALLNFRRVQVDFIVASAKPPLIIVIVACLLIGVVLGLIGGRTGRRRS